MYPHLQAILTEIEQEAEARSRIAAANADLIERAGALVDTLNRTGAVADMCLHWHYDPELKITIQASTRFVEAEFAAALRGAGIDVQLLHESFRRVDGGDEIGRFDLEKNIMISVNVEHLPASQKEAA